MRRIEGFAGAAAVVQGLVFGLQAWRDPSPVVERLLQGGGDGGHGEVARQIAADDDQLAVARAVLQGGEFHGVNLLRVRRAALQLFSSAHMSRSRSAVQTRGSAMPLASS